MYSAYVHKRQWIKSHDIIECARKNDDLAARRVMYQQKYEKKESTHLKVSGFCVDFFL